MHARILILLTTTLALVGCSVSSVGSSVPTSPTAIASHEDDAVPTATASANVTPPATAQPSLGASTLIVGELLARLTVYPDVYAAPVPPTVSVYSDGHVVAADLASVADDRARYLVRRLTPAGLVRVLAEFDSALSASEAGVATPDPSAGYGGGFNTYVLLVRRGDRLVTARATNAATPAASHAMVELGERWVGASTALPPEVWLDAAPSAFVATNWSLWLLPAGSPAGPALDASVLSAHVGDLATFGTPTESGIAGARCGMVDRPTVEAFSAGLEAAGVPRPNLLDRSDVTIRHGTAFADVTLVPALPDETTKCPSVAP